LDFQIRALPDVQGGCFFGAVLIASAMPHKKPPFASFHDLAARLAECGNTGLKGCFAALAIFQAIILALGSNAIAADEGWTVATRSPEVVVYERPRKGYSLQEFKAVGVMDVSPEVLKRVIDDVSEYPHFMPYVTEARVLSGDAVTRVSYQKISPPMVSDMDYTVRVNCEIRSTPAGKCFCNRWQTANDLGPAEKSGVRRVKVTEGSWLLEPEDGGKKTRATYCVFSDTGGSLPAFILNTASRTAIPKLFKSIQKQAQLPKYQHP
jgi:hypothetical protein